MAPSAEPAVHLSSLPQADGSATFSHNGFTIIAAANGPIEVQRRDENPFESVIDVNIRPAAGVGGTAERQLESILQRALKQLVPVRNFPRTLIQITLQITEEPENAYSNTKTVQARPNLSILPALVHAAILALLAGAVPLKAIATSICIATLPSGNSEFKLEPTPREADQARALHVLVFTSHNELLLSESEGAFTVEEWDKVLQIGEQACCRDSSLDDDVEMTTGTETKSIKSFIRSVMKMKTADDLHWR